MVEEERKPQSLPNLQDVQINVKNISVCYDNFFALKDVSFKVMEGQIISIVGPSGSGKSTLLKVIAGLENLSDGQIFQKNNLVATNKYSLPPSQRNMSMVFQDHALFPHMKAIENIMFPIKLKDKNWSSQKRKRSLATIEKLLEDLHLEDFANSYPHQLSGGQRQRVSLARALIVSPKILLLDEPFASQDQELKGHLKDIMLKLIKKKNITTIIVTHDQNEALSLSEKMGILRKGKLEQFATTFETYHFPSNRFVANFMGMGTFLPGKIVDDALVTEFGIVKRFRYSNDVDLKKTNEVSVFLRPDDVVISTNSAIKAKVISRVFLGASLLYRLKLDTGSEVLSIMNARLSKEINAYVSVTIELTRLIVYERAKVKQASYP